MDSEVHPENAPAGMSSMPVDRVTSVSDLQSENAESPSDVTLSGSSTVLTPEAENAFAPMVRTVSGMAMSLRAVHPEKAESPMDVVLSG